MAFLLLQDRSRVSKLHLQETVEEMGAFNTRRKLKGAVLAAVSSAKWKKEGEEECLVDFQDDDVTSAGNLFSCFIDYS